MHDCFETTAEMKTLLRAFSQGFEALYQNIEPCEQPKLLRLAPVLFRKWCCAPLLDETILSPANLVAASYGKEGYVCPALRVKPEAKGLGKFQYTLRAYTLEDHPFVADLRRLLEVCRPYGEIDEEGLLLPAYREKLSEELSLADPYYGTYLTLLARRLGLLVELPALYRQLLQPAGDAAAFFAQDPLVLWQRIVDAALELASYQFGFGLSNLMTEVPEDLLRDFLYQPITVDEMFLAYYNLLGVDFSHFMDLAEEGELPEMEGFLYHATMYFGVLADRWFFTPFGEYMKLIQPLYMNHYDFSEEINYVCTGLAVDPDASMEVFSPCLLYDYTPLGVSLLCRDRQAPPNRQKMPESLPFSDIWYAYRLNAASLMAENAEANRKQQESEVFTLQIQFSTARDYWKTLQCMGDLSLEDLHEELVQLFDLEDGPDYCFSAKGGEYSPVRKGRLRIRRDADIPLTQLGLQEGDLLSYRPASTGQPQLELRLLRRGKGRPYLRYPRIIGQSKALTDYEKTLYYD